MEQKERNRWFFGITRAIALASPDQSTKVGCIVVGPRKEIRAQGYNGFPRGVDDTCEAWHQRPAKYAFTVHAEANAVCNAALIGTSLEGCTAYITAPPCCNCAALMVNAGITQVNWIDRPLDPRWEESCLWALELFDAAGVSYRTFPVGDV